MYTRLNALPRRVRACRVAGWPVSCFFSWDETALPSPAPSPPPPPILSTLQSERATAAAWHRPLSAGAGARARSLARPAAPSPSPSVPRQCCPRSRTAIIRPVPRRAAGRPRISRRIPIDNPDRTVGGVGTAVITRILCGELIDAVTRSRRRRRHHRSDYSRSNPDEKSAATVWFSFCPPITISIVSASR